MKTNLKNSLSLPVQTPKYKVGNSIEFNPYFRSANLEKCGEYKTIPANKERVKKAGRAIVIINTKKGTSFRMALKTKSDVIYAHRISQFLKPREAKEVETAVLSVKPAKWTMKRIRKVMRTNGKGSFLMVWKTTNGETTKFFTTKAKAQAFVKTQKVSK